MKSTRPVSPVFDVVLFNSAYRAVCRNCGHNGPEYARDYQAIGNGGSHSCTAVGIASIFSGVIK